jgi:CubicO group peptidase (beta-lactamase class C family)
MPANQLPDSIQLEVDEIINAELAASAVPGAAVGIVHDGALAAFRSYGESHIGTGESPTARSIARVASVTKTFTATAIMRLRDASQLELDDPLLLHLPEFTNAQAISAPLEGVTIRRMLTHHSGLSTEHPDTDWDIPEFPSREHLLDTLERLQVVIPQDSQWKYSNLAYSLLGEVIARLSGKPYLDYMYEEIIGPLGLENTAFDLSAEQAKLKMTGYSPPKPGDTGFRVAPVAHLNSFTPAGQLQTNVEDLATWIGFQLGSGPESILSMQSLAEMHRPIYIENDWSSGQCLGWRATRRGQRVYLNHGGAVHGFATSVFFNVPSRVGVIVLVNMWPMRWSPDLPMKIADSVIDGIGSGSAANADDDKPAAQGAPTEFDGDYWAEPGILLTVEPTATGIAFAKPAPGESALHTPALLERSGEEDSFRIVNGRGAGEVAVFARNESGKITDFTLGGFRYRKIS